MPNLGSVMASFPVRLAAGALLLPTYKAHRVLYYHVVCDDILDYYPLKKPFSTQDFISQIEWLMKMGYKFMPLSEAVEVIKQGERLFKTVSITTDDGFACNYDVFKAVMQKYKVKPTFFVLSDTIDNKALCWNHKLLIIKGNTERGKLTQVIKGMVSSFEMGKDVDVSPDNLFHLLPMQAKDSFTDRLWQETQVISQREYLAEQQPFLTGNMMRELVAVGAEMGTHGRSHADFQRLTYEDACAEIKQSQQVLQNINGRAVTLFSYPYGRRMDAVAEKRVQDECGLTAMFGTRYGLTDNCSPNSKWEREMMERSARENYQSFIVAPLYRFIRDKSLLKKRSR